MKNLPAMKRVWSGSSLPDTAHFVNLLEHAGVACVIKNRELGGGLGDLPVLDCSPEIWVLDDGDADRAEALIRDSVQPAAAAASWCCPRCGEDNEPQFAACWSCGRGDSPGEPP
jgi:Putative prokaryotic signal transducing protein